ncbi:methylthioribulose 1-phosphate dehydratase [Trichormus variabilis]|uniref:Methylthioribulose-1-phosphate dehydratase n=1 Tax=Trichormus variabilis SAG 1403-4b TaxID=447716 RepID=A0A433UWA4_ANAVA|nr:methylthioribulose 1-phosphate dehydratase [Trichormus variabilis]MBD2626283.1 methylthioribulose 1-phosphate dehydratase [Trichormus variabilis FACHB-164]RUS98099.1 methylthioribulose-1-phosphate dehydratase [Trichormus variabilis SAG 1403-4b]
MNTDPRPTLIAAARQFYQMGWMIGTAGNLSARRPDGNFWITASGCPKNQLIIDDFVLMTLDACRSEAYLVPQQSHTQKRPSAETSIHAAIYSLFPDAQACYHVHSIENNLVSRLIMGDALPLPPLEMLKGLGVWEENPQVAIPIFANHLEVSRIADEICTRFKTKMPQVPVLLIRDHGVTVWASSLEGVSNYLEIAEYIFRYMVAGQKIGLELG